MGYFHEGDNWKKRYDGVKSSLPDYPKAPPLLIRATDVPGQYETLVLPQTSAPPVPVQETPKPTERTGL